MIFVDGDGAKRLYKGVARDIIGVQDIDMSKPKKFHVRDSDKYNYMDYNDVVKNKPKSTYIRDPLNPIYTFRDKQGEIYEYGNVEGSRPR